jgi:hypothetical protein
MENEAIRPSFLASYFEALREKAAKRKLASMLPVWLFFFILLGAAISWHIPSELWLEKNNWQTSVAMYAAVLTFNGLMLALSWSAFSRIHEAILSSPGFSLFLRQEKLLNTYLFYIDYVHVAQVVAVCVSAVAMFTLVMELPNVIWHRAIAATTIGLSGYAIKYAINAVVVMHDLVWQRAIFEGEIEEPKKSANVLRLPKDR